MRAVVEIAMRNWLEQLLGEEEYSKYQFSEEVKKDLDNLHG